jgi:hypothetical protein
MEMNAINANFHRKKYDSLSGIQADVDHWMRFFNPARPRSHSGKYGDGKTPWQTWLGTK